MTSTTNNNDIFKFTNYLPRKLTPEQNTQRKLLSKEGEEYIEWPDLLHLKASVDYDVFGKKIGALYLKKEGISPCFTFGWKIQGTHIYDLARQITGFYDSWVSGLRGAFPFHLTWKIHAGTRQSSVERVIDLSQLLATCENEAIAQIVMDEIASVQELTKDRKRKDRFIHLYATYWSGRDKSLADVEDKIEGYLKAAFGLVEFAKTSVSTALDAVLGSTIDTVSNRGAQRAAQQMEALFKGAHSGGHQAVSNVLCERMGLIAEPMTHDEILSNLRARFSGDEAGQSPNKINCVIDDRGVQLSEEIHGQHIANWLPKDGPIDLGDAGVSIKRWNPETEEIETDFIAVLEARKKVEGWKHEFNQLCSLWESLQSSANHDVEFFIDLSGANRKIIKEHAGENYKQSRKRAEKAARTRDFSATANRGINESASALTDLDSAETVVKAAFVVLVHAKSISALDLACRNFQSDFRVTPLEREFRVSQMVWLQTLPCQVSEMLKLTAFPSFSKNVTPIESDFRHVHTCTQAIGFLPFATTLKNDKNGIELISRDGQYLYVDIFSPLKQSHWLLAAKQRQGKSYLACKISDHAMARKQPVTWIDMPPENDEASALEMRCRVLGGAHVDCRKESLNILGISAAFLLKDSKLSPKQRQDRWKGLQGTWLEMLMIFGGPTKAEPQLAQVIHEILQIAIELFTDDRQIKLRYVEAVKAGIGSEAWARTPTLVDFAKFIRPETLQHRLGEISGPVEAALKHLNLQLARKCDPNSTIGQAIARPSTVDIENSLLTVFSLRGMQLGSEESLAYVMGAYACAIQKSLSHEISHVIFEEAQKATEEEGVTRMMSDLITRYGKDGVRVGVVTNSLSKVAKSSAGRDLLDNFTTKFLGPIEETSVESYSEILNLPPDMVAKCAQPTFYTDRKNGAMNILLYDNGRNTLTRFFPGWLSNSLNASNRNERTAKAAFMDAIEDKAIALAAFSRYYRRCAEAEKAVTVLPIEKIKEFESQCLF